MRIYKITYGDWGAKAENNETLVEWATNKKDAKRIARENNDGDYLSRIEVFDISITRFGLKDFLNNHAWR